MKVIDKKTLQLMISQMRQDVRKCFCSTTDACEILDVSYNKFYRLLEEPECKIRMSKIKGKYLLKSVYEEVERLTLK